MLARLLDLDGCAVNCFLPQWGPSDRLRLALHRGTIDKLRGEVVHRASPRHTHKDRIKRLKGTGTPGMAGKTAVMGLLELHDQAYRFNARNTDDAS